jgi:acyl carrier protein
LLVVDAADRVRSFLYGYALDLVGQESIRLGVCSDEDVMGTPAAVLGVARWVEAARLRFPIARILLEGPASRFSGPRWGDVLIGPLVHRPDSWWNGDCHEPYEMWELDHALAIELEGRLKREGAPGGGVDRGFGGARRLGRGALLSAEEFTLNLAAALDVDTADEGLFDLLDSLGMLELLVVVSELAGAEVPDDALGIRLRSIEEAFDLYRRLRSTASG